MSEYPIVRLKRIETVGPKIKSSRRIKPPAKIPYQAQASRLGQVFDRAAAVLLDFERGIEVAADPAAVVPERCLVFELIGPVYDFNVAALALGLDWLRTDPLTDDAAADDEEAGDAATADDDDLRPKLLYLTMPSPQALSRLLAQWNKYKAGEKPQYGYGSLWAIFGYLADLRGWSVQDRLDAHISEYISAVLSDDTVRDVSVEIDLWYRNEKERRDKSISTLTSLLQEVGGELLDLVDIEEIRYQGALVRLPSNVARRLAQGEGDIPHFDDIMSIRPQSAYHSHIVAEPPEMRDLSEGKKPSGPCLAVLLDGYPVVQHKALDGRLRVMEVDVSGGSVPVSARFHGTAMASLVVHGDLHEVENMLERPVGVIPVLTGAGGPQESTPPGKLAVGVIYRALRKVIEARQTNDPDFGRIVVINHSLCDEFHPYVRRLSPWATLLDHFSYTYSLLFVVSAGNIFKSFSVPEYASIAEFQDADVVEREAAIVLAVEAAKGTRGLLSPAESVNALTVGAIHADFAPRMPPAGVDPFPNLDGMASLVSAVGLGTNRSVKPDLVEHGGRFLAAPSVAKNDVVDVHGAASPHVGQLVAAPSATGDNTVVLRTSGTSNAAAMVTRSCHFIADALDESFAADGIDWTGLVTRAVLPKALLAHSCAWRATGAFLHENYPPQGPYTALKRRDTISRFLGYGRPDRERVISGGENRITLLAEDVIYPEERHEYRLPIPAAMIGTKDVRSLSLTLAWTCPVTNLSVDYRGVALKLCDQHGKTGFWEGVERKEIYQPNATTAARGTLVHMVLEGTRKMPTTDGQLVICVQATAGRKEFGRAYVPYALAITLEMAQSQKTNLYTEIRTAIRGRVRT